MCDRLKDKYLNLSKVKSIPLKDRNNKIKRGKKYAMRIKKFCFTKGIYSSPTNCFLVTMLTKYN